eukprot:6437730-Prymnesium_polylepis.1
MVCVGLLAGAAQKWWFAQTMRHSNRPAGAVARSDRLCRSGGPVDHPGPSRVDCKGVHARSQTHALIRTS